MPSRRKRTRERGPSPRKDAPLCSIRNRPLLPRTPRRAAPRHAARSRVPFTRRGEYRARFTPSSRRGAAHPTRTNTREHAGGMTRGRDDDRYHPPPPHLSPPSLHLLSSSSLRTMKTLRTGTRPRVVRIKTSGFLRGAATETIGRLAMYNGGAKNRPRR